jgi:pilus assembly protein FimV
MGLGDAFEKHYARAMPLSVPVAALSGASTLGPWGWGAQSSAAACAEIDVTSLTPEEAGNLKIRIAAPDTYRASGVDYNVVLPSTQATLLKRADGSPFLRLTSDRVVQEPSSPFLELSGRLAACASTLLLDPATDRPQAAASSEFADFARPRRVGPACAPQPRAGSGAGSLNGLPRRRRARCTTRAGRRHRVEAVTP